MLLTGLIALIVALAIWNLMLKVADSVVSANFDPADYVVFQALFGMIFMVIIALEFKRSLVIIAERKQNIARSGAQAHDFRSGEHGCFAIVRARSDDPGARRRVLACSRPGSQGTQQGALNPILIMHRSLP